MAVSATKNVFRRNFTDDVIVSCGLSLSLMIPCSVASASLINSSVLL